MKQHSKLSIVLSTGALLALAACATPDGGAMPASMPPFSQAALPEAVQVPLGHRVAMETRATGDITYECRAKKDLAGQFEWIFVSPEASLRDRQGRKVGRYYGPPATWDFADSSKVTGTQLAVAANGSGNIPSQLVKTSPAMGSGMATGVTHIQRVATQGGIAPNAPCDASKAGTKQTVPYEADYILWKAAV